MDSFEMNKIIGALLATVFIVFSVAIMSDGIFASPNPATEGYKVEPMEVGGAGEGGAAAAETVVPIAVRMQTADAAAGEALFKRCAACHTDDSGGANKIGPNLWGVINRPVASHAGFAYSGAMKEFAQGGSVVWDYEHLDHFIVAPKSLVKGTAMSFAGLKDPKDRANLIAYLRTTADSEAPLPEVPADAAQGDAAAAPADGQAPAEGQAPAQGGAPAEGQAPAPAPAEGQAPAPAEGEAPAQGEAPAPAPTTNQ